MFERWRQENFFKYLRAEYALDALVDYGVEPADATREVIGSGHVEASCETLVAVRMKRAGSRWKTDTGERILQLRALALSHRWEPAISKLHATRRRAVQAVA